MNFTQHCEAASLVLQKLSELIDAAEAELLRLEDDRQNTALLTQLVQKILVAKPLTEELLHTHIPAIEQEDRAVGHAITIAHRELLRRLCGVRHDLEIITKVPRRGAPKLAAVLPLKKPA